jgi:hypothetical protein
MSTLGQPAPAPAAPDSIARVARLVAEQLDSRCPTTYVWSYESALADLRALYEKAKGEQWNGQTYLPWDVDVDPERELFPDMMIPIYGTEHWRKLDERGVRKLRSHWLSWFVSQFMHGEQGALLATSQIVATVPSIDAKFYGSTQVMDEARHVEVYERYLREKVGHHYPVNPELRTLLDQILCDSRWDMKYLGMQILVEGLALAAFKFIHQFTNERLLKELTHAVMKDEARHVAFGVLSLQSFYRDELNEKERREREEFTYEACRLMRDRLLGSEVWEHLGFDTRECTRLALESPSMQEYRRLLFMRIVPNIKRLNLLTPFLRERFTELGVLQYEDLPADG